MFLNFSESESKRFNLQIFRATAPQIPQIPDFLAEGIANKADIIILRSDIEHITALIPELSRRCHTITADALIEFHKVLRKDTIADELGAKAEISEAGESDRARLVELIPRCYAEYTNHYHANPCIDSTTVLDGLVEHSLSFLAKENRCIFVATAHGRDCGYLCMEIRDGVGSTVFGGSALDIPAGLRHKILCDLTHHGDLWLMARGVTRFRAITRTDKTYIQKLLVHNMHTLPAQTLVTLHLNLFAGRIAALPLSEPKAEDFASGKGYAASRYLHLNLRQPGKKSGNRTYIIENSRDKYVYSGDYDQAGLYALRTEILSR